MASTNAQQSNATQSKGAAASKTVRLGVIGVRNIGRTHIRRTADLENVQVVAVADTDPERVKETQEEFNVEQGYTDADELLAKAEIDAVVLAVPNHLHVPFAVKAMERGLHVMVEKPLSHDIDEAKQAIEVRDRTGCTLMVGMNQRFNAQARAVRELLASGKLGAPKYCRANWLRPDLAKGIVQRGAWMFDRSQGGGPLLDLGIHKLDLALYLLGFPKAQEVMSTRTTTVASRFAKTSDMFSDIEDYAWGCYRFENNLLLELSASLTDPSVEVETSDVIIFCEFGGVMQQKGKGISAFTYDDKGDRVPIELPEQDDLSTTTVEHLVRLVQGRETIVPTAEEAILGVELINAMQRAADEGRTITLD